MAVTWAPTLTPSKRPLLAWNRNPFAGFQIQHGYEKLAIGWGKRRKQITHNSWSLAQEISRPLSTGCNIL